MKGELRKGVWMLVLLLFAFSGLANADTVIDLIGEDDRFGIGATPGSGFYWTSLGSGNGDGAEEWITYDYTLDDVLVGILTDGDNVGSAYNYARLDAFTLMPFLGFINGVETIRVDCFNRGGDGWVLDFSQVTISDDNTAPISEPATMLLFGTGLVGLAAARRRKKA